MKELTPDQDRANVMGQALLAYMEILMTRNQKGNNIKVEFRERVVRMRSGLN